jgi:ribosomal protein S12 methylthiotransferase accessory factor
MSAQDRPLQALWAGASLMEQAYLLPDEGAPPRAAGDFAEAGAGDLRDGVLECVDRLARAEIEALALDLSRPDVGLRAARVFAPGLRHAWPRFAPGRLYDVPVRLGWRGAPLREGELNPAPMIGY